MTGWRRICLDVSYTRTQTGNVGITRTVRKLLAALQEAEAQTGVSCIPVAFHSTGFRTAASTSASTPPPRTKPATRLYRWFEGGRVRRLAQFCVPLPLLEAGWTIASRLAFDASSQNEAAVRFGPGDLLVLADECWNYKVQKAAALARSQGAKVVLVLYDLIPLRQPEYCAPLFTRVFRPWLLNVVPQCDVVMCISRSTELDFRSFCQQENVPVPTTGSFRLGCDISAPATAGQVRPEVAAFAERPGAWFASVGTIEPRKNHALLLDVFEHLWRRGIDAGLLVAGRPHPACAALVARMQRHPEQGRRLLTLLDASDAEVNLAYSRCRALLFPTLAEGFGLPLVEARSRGCTVLASALPALLELADDGVQFFSPGSADALEALVLDQAALPARALAPPPQVFTWRQSAGQFLARIQEVLSEHEH